MTQTIDGGSTIDGGPQLFLLPIQHQNNHKNNIRLNKSRLLILFRTYKIRWKDTQDLDILTITFFFWGIIPFEL